MRPNVLFLCSYYPTRLRGGGNFIERHARSAALFSNIFVLTLEPDSELTQPYELAFSYDFDGKIPTVRAYYALKCINIPILRSVIRLKRFLQAAWAGYQILKKESPSFDLVHLHVVRPLGIFAKILKWKEKLNYIVTEHSTAYLDENKGAMSYFETIFTGWILRGAKKILPVSVLLKNAIQKRFGIKDEAFEVVSNVVETDVFFLRKEGVKVVNNAKTRFLHVSNLKDFKKVDAILRVFKQLSTQRTDFELHIIGDGDDRQLMEKLALECDLLNKKVFFHGIKTMQETADWMREVDCFVLFSTYETASMVVMESLCCGLPVISTKVGIVPENIVEKENGLLVDVNNEAQLLDALVYFLDNKTRFRSLKPFECYADKFSEKTIGNQLLTIYKRFTKTKSTQTKNRLQT